MKTRLLAVILACSATAWAADREFDRIVKAIETHYGAKQTHIPLMGVANLFVKVARPAGTSSFKLAVFEDLQAPSDGAGLAELDRLMDGIAGKGLSPMVRTRSNRSGESTYIFAGEAGKSTKLLIATFERHEAVVIAVKVNAEALMRTLERPETAGKVFRGEKHTERDWN